MWNTLFVLILSILTIISFVYNYVGNSYIDINENNQILWTLNNNFLPYEKLEIESYKTLCYPTQCIKNNVTDCSLLDKKNTIVFFINWTSELSFDCSSKFYKEWDAWINIEELYWRLYSQCIIEDTTDWNEVYSCLSKLNWAKMTWDWYEVCSNLFWEAEFWCTQIIY